MVSLLDYRYRLSKQSQYSHPHNSIADKESKLEDLEVDLKLQAERRKSLLDHHWAVPSKDRYDIDAMGY